MGDADKFDAEHAQVDHIPRADHAQIDLVVQLVFLEFFLDEAQSQGGAVDWGIYLAQDEGKCADMVFMTVGEKDRPHLFRTVGKIGDVWNDDVDAEHIRLGKHQATVDDDDVITVFENGHVEADLAETARGMILRPMLSLMGVSMWFQAFYQQAADTL